MKEALSRGGSQAFQVLGIACAKAQRHKRRSRFDVVGDKVGEVKETGRGHSQWRGCGAHGLELQVSAGWR